MNPPADKLIPISFIATDVDGVLTNGLMGFDASGAPFRHFNAKDGLGLALWYCAGGKAALVSGQGSKAVEAVARQWKVTDCKLNARDKVKALRELARDHGFELKELAFIGDDLLDLRAIQAAGLGIAVADAAPQVREAAAWVTQAPGGGGALREVVEGILSVQGKLDEAVALYCESPPDVQ